MYEHVGEVPPHLLPLVRVVDEPGAVGDWPVEADVADLGVHHRAVVREDGRLQQGHPEHEQRRGGAGVLQGKPLINPCFVLGILWNFQPGFGKSICMAR